MRTLQVVLLLSATLAASQKLNLLPALDPLDEIANLTVEEKWIRMEKRLRGAAGGFLRAFTPDLLKMIREIEISTDCTGALLRWMRGIRKLDFWAISLLDSSGKFPEGMYTGSMSAFGAYDQCLDITTDYFTGQYCTAHIRPFLPPKPEFVRGSQPISELLNLTQHSSIIGGNIQYAQYFYILTFRLGLCLPSVCTAADLNNTLHTIGRMLYLEIWTSGCEVKETLVLTTLELVAIGILSVFAIIVAVGTYIDVFHCQTSEKHGIPIQLLTCFSFYTNTIRLLSTEQKSDDAIKQLYGLRFFSILWIILCHSYLYSNLQMLKGLQWVETYRQNIPFQIIGNGTVAVDSFFVISGLLVSYVSVNLVFKLKKKFSVPMAIIHRLWRLTPVHVMVIIISFLMRIFSNGPAWKEHVEPIANRCKKTWWANLLYINNFIDTSRRCLSHSWYLSVDTQLYLLSLIVLVILFKSKKTGLVLSVGLILGSIVSTAYATYILELPPTLLVVHPDPESRLKIMNELYVLPHTHAGAYFVGFLLGYILVMHPNIKMPKLIVAAGWLISAFTALSVLFGVQPWNSGKEPEFWESLAYSGLHRTAWALSIAWVILACRSGYGAWVNNFLCWKGIYAFSRLTYVAYLMHPIIQQALHGNLRSPLQANHHIAVYAFFGHIITTYLISFFICLAFESPFLAMEKIFLRGSKVKKVPQEKTPVPNGISNGKSDSVFTAL